MMKIRKIDLHMHSTVSDGTDSPEELLRKVKEAGIDLFALTDHDAVKGYGMIRDIMEPGDPMLLSGAEFSCEDEQGKYHILGYNYDPEAEEIRQVIEAGHQLRIEKAALRLEHLKTAFGFTFPEEEVQKLFALDNPGKPHIGNLMVRYGFAESKDQAIREYLNVSFPDGHIRPETAIRGILEAGGIPVLAHPVFGSGEELVMGDELDERVRRLIGFGLKGIEGFYSGFTPRLRLEVLAIADRYDLFVTAGSDYHGKNKLVKLGYTGLQLTMIMPKGLRRFLEAVGAGEGGRGRV